MIKQVKKYKQLFENNLEINFNDLNDKLIDKSEILGLIYAFKTNNIDKEEYGIRIFEDIEDFINNALEEDLMNELEYLVKLILDTGVDININIGRDYTILMIAGYYNIPYFMEYLIKNGADVNIVNDENETFFDIIKKENTRIEEEKTPLLYKLYNKSKEVKRFKI